VALLVLILVSSESIASPTVLPKRPSTPELLQLLKGGSTDALAGSIRGYLVRSMPDPLYESWPGWGHTADVARGIRWKGLQPEIMRSSKSDGKWRHIQVHAIKPADTLILDIRDLAQPEPGRITFAIFLSMDARLDYEQQNWRNGVRTYSGSARVRFRARATL